MTRDDQGRIVMTDDEMRLYLLEWRGIEERCQRCDGSGARVYGSTATWRGGVGGQMMTADVCDKCWGSGDAGRAWWDLRAHLNAVDIQTAERAVELLARSVGASMQETHPAIAVIVATLTKLANKRGAPAAAHLPELARGLANTLRRAIGVAEEKAR